MLSSLWKCYLCSTTVTHKERYTHQKSELPAAIRFYLHAVLFTAMAQSFEWTVKASSAAMERLTGGSNESPSKERGLKNINLRLNN